MNYLAHFHLSQGDDGLLVGALLGDFVKGPLNGQYRPSVEQGILLHRKIDAFTDSHAALRLTHQRFESRYRRFAGIMTDVVFDYFLNRHWQTFHDQPLDLFCSHIYQLLSKNQELTPAAQRQADNLCRYAVLENYQHWETVDRALTGISQRIKRETPLASAAKEMLKHHSTLEQQFLAFYPELQRHVSQIRQSFKKA